MSEPMSNEIKSQILAARMDEMTARERILKLLVQANLKAKQAKEFCEQELDYNFQETRATLAAAGLIITSDSLTSKDPKTLVNIQKLKLWRKEKAKQAGLPAYRVLTNRALLAIASECPKTTESLLELKGFGQKSAENYGTDLLELLKC